MEILVVAIATASYAGGGRSYKQRNNQASNWAYREDRQRYGQRNNAGNNQPNMQDYYYDGDDDGSCDIEVACR